MNTTAVTGITFGRNVIMKFHRSCYHADGIKRKLCFDCLPSHMDTCDYCKGKGCMECYIYYDIQFLRSHV